MPAQEMKQIKDRMEKTVEHLRSELQGVRTGRAHPALVEEIKVDYYGAQTPIRQMGTVNVPEPRQIVISPWDRASLKAIEKALLASPLGVTPQNDGENIRINLPELTRERRLDLTKLVRKYAEEAKVAVRNLRRDGNETLKKLEKDSKVTEDAQHKLQKELQDVTDAMIKKIDQVLNEKEKEIMEE